MTSFWRVTWKSFSLCWHYAAIAASVTEAACSCTESQSDALPLLEEVQSLGLEHESVDKVFAVCDADGHPGSSSCVTPSNNCLRTLLQSFPALRAQDGNPMPGSIPF